jgi:hypothetical protein
VSGAGSLVAKNPNSIDMHVLTVDCQTVLHRTVATNNTVPACRLAYCSTLLLAPAPRVAEKEVSTVVRRTCGEQRTVSCVGLEQHRDMGLTTADRCKALHRKKKDGNY